MIRCDNTNTVDIFQTLRAHRLYNELLKFAVDLLMTHEVDLRVVRIPGEKNGVADALSRFKFDEARKMHNTLSIAPFQPPVIITGAGKQ